MCTKAVPRFSPYAGDAGLAPYRYAIAEVSSAGGLAFWAHPEAATEFRHSRYPVTYRSNAYPDFVARADEATGFASLFEGYREAAAVGGFWDQALARFCRGDRDQPPWTLGEISLHEEGEAGGKHLRHVETILRARERSRAAVLEALGNGAGYAVRHPPESRIVVDAFTVAAGNRKAHMGERLFDSGPRHIEIRLCREGKGSDPVEITVVRDGASVWTASADVTEEGVSLHWEDASPISTLSYYRLAVEGKYPEMILGNPVFVALRRDSP